LGIIITDPIGEIITTTMIPTITGELMVTGVRGIIMVIRAVAQWRF
jgi:hypothetical protein